jgi:uncharacterized protein YbjT (DUF2867 family)
MTGADQPVQRVLVLGGTGFVGRALAEQLLRQGGVARQIRVPTRHLSHGRVLGPLPTVELVQADVHEPATLVRLMRGCDAVVNLVAILHGDAKAFARVHVELPRRIAEAAALAGVRRLVHLSALGVGGHGTHGALDGRLPSHYLRSKAEGESRLRHARRDLTVLRPSVIFGAGDRFMNLFARLQAWLPAVALAGADARFQPVWVEDVAAAIVACLERPITIGQTFELAGPEVFTLAELVRLAGRVSGHPRPVLPLPRPVGRLQAALLSLLPGEPLMSADNLDSMRVPNVASGQLPGLAELGIRASALSAVLPTYLAPHHGCARLDRWRAQR